MEEKNWNPETRIEVPIAGKVKPPKVTQGFFPQGGRMDEKDWARPNKEKSEAFLPEGRTEIPLVAVDVKINEKKDMAFVDTLAMQTKLGVMNRAGEQSMSMRDSEIVRARNISSTTPFAQGGTATIIGDAVPRSILTLDPQIRMPGQKPLVPGVGNEVPMASQPAVPMGKPVSVQVLGGPGPQESLTEMLLAELREKVLKMSGMPMSEKEAREKLAEIQRKLQGTPPAPAAPVAAVPAFSCGNPPLVAPELPKHQPIVVEPVSKPVVVETVDLKKKVEENIALMERAAELEAENATLLSIVTRLAAENKALKAKK